MNYEFPIIETLDDVLPAIEGRDEFIVAERPDYFVVNYLVAFSDTFVIDPTDLMENHGKMIPKGLMRRECRGLIFDRAGKLISRPWHKFFNINEKEETQANLIDFSQPHVIMEKMDGSMIRPLMFDDTEVHMATKMGITEIGVDAKVLLYSYDDAAAKIVWIADAVKAGMTPLFEYVGPANRIVIKYDVASLVFLGLRDNRTGKYFANDFTDAPFEYGPVYGTMADYLAK